MLRFSLRLLLVVTLLAIQPVTQVDAQTSLRQVASGFANPVGVYHAPGNNDRLFIVEQGSGGCLLYTSPSPRDATLSRMPSSA